MTKEKKILIEACGISKQFGGVEVLSDINLDLCAGEIHALLGENGAGKSTFAKILAGVHRPTRGQMKLTGEPVDVSSPIVAQARFLNISAYIAVSNGTLALSTCSVAK